MRVALLFMYDNSGEKNKEPPDSNRKDEPMNDDRIKYFKKPELDNPILVAGFNGWANAGDVTTRSISYLAQKLNAPIFAEIDPDPFFNFEANRPMVEIQGGQVVSIMKPQGRFHICKSDEEGSDLIIFSGDEPHFRWNRYLKTFLDFAEENNVSLIITIGSGYDQVLHYEEKISSVVSNTSAMNLARKLSLPLLEYTSQASVSLLLISEAENRGMTALGLWAHAPFYIHGTNYKLCSRVIEIISEITGIALETLELRSAWESLEKQINTLIEKNEKLRQQIKEISRTSGTEPFRPPENIQGAKVIHLDEFLKKKDEA